MKRNIILVAIFTTFLATTAVAMAHSTIYVDDIGRLHFLGRDPGSKAKYVQEVGNFDNPEQKDLTNIIYKNTTGTTKSEKQINSQVTDSENNVNKVNKSSASYKYTKGTMDASNPYTYGNTNIEQGVNNTKTIYTDEIGRQHFLGKDNVQRY